MTNDQRQILHIDMNSYFATVEQQANPYLRGKPVGVKGSAVKRTIVAAASIEAKKFGVKSGMRVEDALELCPELILVVGEPIKYSSVTKQFIEIFERYTDRVEIFSIDEAFLDVTGSAHLYMPSKKQTTNNKNQIPARIGRGGNYKFSNTKRLDPHCGEDDKGERNDKQGVPVILGTEGTPESDSGQARMTIKEDFSGAVEIAKRIKSDIRREIGEWLTCSVGVAPNKFLAKLGSDLEKPDGLVVITEKNKDEILISCELTDFCGIASLIEARLNRMGIYSVKDLREADDLALKKEFGTYGLKIKRMSLGIDSSEVLDWHEQADAKSFGHSRTLNKDVTDMTEIKGQLYLLSEKVAKRMRDEKYFGKEVGVWIRFKDFSGVSKRHRIGYWVNDGYEIYNAVCEILEEIYGLDPRCGEDDRRGRAKPVRAMGVYVTRISKNAPHYLFDIDKKQEQITKTIDKVNNRFGENTLFKGILLNFPFKKIVSGMGRKKF